MGLGDVVIPGVLVASSFVWLPQTLVDGVGANLIVALAAMVGSLVGYAVLMWRVSSGNPQAGLPFLNGGAIAGYVVAVLPPLPQPFLGDLPVGAMPRTVRDIRIDDAPSLDTLVRRMEDAGGFSAKGVAQGVDVLARILADEEMTVFLSFPADIVATGTRGVLETLVRDGYVDAVVTTCGTLDHDLARSLRPVLPRRLEPR